MRFFGLPLIVMLFLFAALSVVCSSKETAKNIVGYTTPANTWHLSSDFSEVELSGFAEIPTELASATMHVDLARTIQFNGKDTLAGVMLLELDDQLAGILITVDGSERSYGYFKDYFKERYGEDNLTINESSCLGWADKDLDSLTLTYNINEDLSTFTSILYMNEALLDDITGYSIPDWMKEVWETADTYDA